LRIARNEQGDVKPGQRLDVHQVVALGRIQRREIGIELFEHGDDVGLARVFFLNIHGVVTKTAPAGAVRAQNKGLLKRLA
jgi:hypothetical protein